MQAKQWIACLFVENNSTLWADSWNGQSFNEEQIKILKRTAKVFEQAYVRFLDLQKAEAQARENQIEAALERVRSKSAAMQQAADIHGVMAKIFTECKLLDIDLDSGAIIIFDESTLIPSGG